MMKWAGKRHLVDGKWTTVNDVAKRLGLNRQQIYNQMHHRQCSLQVVVNMVRENLSLNGGANGERHMVGGKWITIRQAADMLGKTPACIRTWRHDHRHADGTPATLAEAVEAYRMGDVRHGGSKPALHRIGRRMMSVEEVAAELGVTVNAVRMYMSKHQCGLSEYVHFYRARERRREEQAKRRAEQEIIIMGD